MSKKFNTSYGTAGGSEYGYKSEAEAKRARAKTTKFNASKFTGKKKKEVDIFARNKKKATSTPMHKWMSQYE